MYGIFLGRFQPFHNGHAKIINYIIKQNVKPIIMIGSTNKDRCLDKNPLNFSQRKALIQTVFPTIPDKDIHSLEDNQNNTIWYQNFSSKIIYPKQNCCIYYHVKEKEKYDFTYQGITYPNSSYNLIFKTEDWKCSQIKVDDMNIHASNIRKEGIDTQKDNLNPKVFQKLKVWGFK